MRTCFLFLLIFPSLFAETIESFYGPIEVEEPVLLELVHCPAMQRLKKIHQYGVAYYTTHREEYTRFDHSIGVFAVLRRNGASVEEQISGLLHDVSHTVFSHVGDWIFGREHQEDDYQNQTFGQYLARSGVGEILGRYGYSIEDVDPKNAKFIMLEQPLPNLCADRIDYNIQGAYFQRFLNREEALEVLEDLHFVNGKWAGTREDLLEKLARFSLFMTLDCWGGALNYMTSRWLADAILMGLETGLLSWEEIHFGVDDAIWEKLTASQNSFIRERMNRLFHPHNHFQLVDRERASLFVRFRCRGIDPWIRNGDEMIRLSNANEGIRQEFEKVKRLAVEGWPLILE